MGALTRVGPTLLSSRFIVISVMIVILGNSLTFGSNVLFFSGYGEGSHYLASTAIAEEMCERGHTVTVMVSSPFRFRMDKPYSCQMKFKVYNISVTFDEMTQSIRKVIKHGYEGNFNKYVMENGRNLSEEVKKHCEIIFLDEELMRSLKLSNINAVVYDSIFACGALIAQYLDARRVALAPTMVAPHQARLHGIPTNPAYHPEGFSGLPSRMRFGERLWNVVCQVGSYWFQIYAFQNPYDEIKNKYNIRPDVTTHELLASADLWLFASDFGFDFAFPMMPNSVAVGGLCTKPAKSLQKDLEDFVQSSGEHGVIVFSLGTYVANTLPVNFFRLVTEVFQRLPQKVIMQYPGDPPEFLLEPHEQIRVMPWLPQNDLLGHEKTVLLMYQGGNNGLHEAIYHGKPLVILPMVGDQHDVAVRAKDRGVGEWLDIRTLDGDELEAVIRKVTTNESFTENMKKISAIFHDRPERPVERASYWIEHVIKYGGDYMRTSGNYDHLNVIQTYLIDIMLFTLLMFVTIVIVSYNFIKVLLQIIRALLTTRSDKAKMQ